MVSKKKRTSEIVEPISSSTSSIMKKHKTSSKEVEIPKSKKPKKEIMKYPYSDDDDDEEEEDQIQKQKISTNYSTSHSAKKRKFEEISKPTNTKLELKSDSSSSDSDDDDSDDEDEDDASEKEDHDEEEEEDELDPMKDVIIKDEVEYHIDDIDEEEEEEEAVVPFVAIAAAMLRQNASSASTDPSATPEWPEKDFNELISRMNDSLPDKDNLKFESRVEKLDWNAIAFGQFSASECKSMWLRIQKRVRRFRVLRELLEDAKGWATKPWTSFYKSNKLNRHPDQPRRPLSTYMLFYMDKKDKVAKQHPGLDMTAVSKLIGEMYKNLPEHKKKFYIDKAIAIRKEYDEKMEIFYRDHPELAQKNDQSEGRARRNEAKPPVKPKTPFMLFLNEQMVNQKDNPDYDKNSIKEKCREIWRTMSDKKKVAWINWALEAETKYKENLKTYIFKNPSFKPPAVKSLLTKEEKLIVERLAGKPVKPPNSGYSLFSRIMLASAEIKKVDSKQRMSKISSLWKDLSDADKKKYQERVIHMLDQYKLEYATYLESLPEDKRREELLASFPKRKIAASKPRSSKPKPKSSAIATVKPTKASKQKKKESSPSPTIIKSSLFKGEPTPPPVNAYQLFKHIYLKKNKTANSAKLDTELTNKWKMLPESEKSKYTRELNEIKDKYIKDFEKFLRSLSQEELKEYSSLKKSSQSEDLSSSHSNSESSEEEDDDDDENDNDNAEEEAEDHEEAEENPENGDQNSDEEDNDSESSQDESVHNSNKTPNGNKEVKSNSGTQNKANEESDDSSSSSSSSDSSSSDSDDSD